jgi:hypothetical protein
MKHLLQELESEFKRGGIVEASIRSKDWHVSGLCESDRVIINPAPDVVDTLMHELLHRRYPRWGEKRVSQTAHRLVSRMSPDDVSRWYRRYQRVAKKRRPVEAD